MNSQHLGGSHLEATLSLSCFLHMSCGGGWMLWGGDGGGGWCGVVLCGWMDGWTLVVFLCGSVALWLCGSVAL